MRASAYAQNEKPGRGRTQAQVHRPGNVELPACPTSLTSPGANGRHTTAPTVQASQMTPSAEALVKRLLLRDDATGIGERRDEAQAGAPGRLNPAA